MKNKGRGSRSGEERVREWRGGQPRRARKGSRREVKWRGRGRRRDGAKEIELAYSRPIKCLI